MITPPIQENGRAVLRAALESAAQFTPVTAALARLYQTTHPTKFETELQAWRMHVSTNIGDLQTRIETLENFFAPKLRLSETATRLAMWLAQNSSNGLTFPDVAFDDVRSALSDLSEGQVEEAAYELESFGLVSTESAIGVSILDIAPSYELFWLFDPLVLSRSPQEDAAEIAAVVVEQDGVNSRELEQRLGWPKRRLNPALALLLSQLDPSCSSNEIQANYVTSYFFITSRERVVLRGLAKARREAP